MQREEQDKLWAELPEKKQKEYKERYNTFITYVGTATHLTNYGWGIKEGEVKILIDMFGEHNLQPSLTYEDVACELFEGGAWQPEDYEHCEFDESPNPTYDFNCTSKAHLEKLIAINKLLNVAKFLNRNEDGSEWVPDWADNGEEKWYILIDRYGNVHSAVDEELDGLNSRIVYFRTEELAKQAVQILGIEVVRTALGNY